MLTRITLSLAQNAAVLRLLHYTIELDPDEGIKLGIALGIVLNSKEGIKLGTELGPVDGFEIGSDDDVTNSLRH
eukprot:6932004-Ditylum_brightwellii.AAC.1